MTNKHMTSLYTHNNLHAPLNITCHHFDQEMLQIKVWKHFLLGDVTFSDHTAPNTKEMRTQPKLFVRTQKFSNLTPNKNSYLLL